MSNSISGSSVRNSQYYSPPLEDKEPGRDLNSKTKALGSEQAHEGDEIELSEQATSETQSHSDGVANESTIVRTLICRPNHEVERVIRVSTEAPIMSIPNGVDKEGHPKTEDSYRHFRVRESVAPHLESVRDEAARQGVHLYSSGGFRELNAEVRTGRSAQSLHYTGRAVDLFTLAGMRNPQTDPYVVVRDGDKWRVYARTTEPHGQSMSLDAVRFVRRGRLPTEQVTGRFVDLTAIFERHGFSRIGPRNSFHMNSNGTHDRGSAEWWHFEYRGGMQRGSTRFGDELQEINRCGPALRKIHPHGNIATIGGMAMGNLDHNFKHVSKIILLSLLYGCATREQRENIVQLIDQNQEVISSHVQPSIVNEPQRHYTEISPEQDGRMIVASNDELLRPPHNWEFNFLFASLCSDIETARTHHGNTSYQPISVETWTYLMHDIEPIIKQQYQLNHKYGESLVGEIVSNIRFHWLTISDHTCFLYDRNEEGFFTDVQDDEIPPIAHPRVTGVIAVDANLYSTRSHERIDMMIHFICDNKGQSCRYSLTPVINELSTTWPYFIRIEKPIDIDHDGILDPMIHLMRSYDDEFIDGYYNFRTSELPQ